MSEWQSGILMGRWNGVAAQRIVSLVPSQTELLYSLGLHEKVVGITKFCVHPSEWFASKMRVGGTKQIDIEKLLSLAPDLVIGNREENEKEQVEAIAKAGIPVYVSEISNIADAYGMMHDVGELTGTTDTAIKICNNIKTGFLSLRNLHQVSFAYFMWHNPYMVAGGDTFISNLLEYVGWKNVFHERQRYPTIAIDDPMLAIADVLLFSSEPFPFGPKHLSDLPDSLRKKSLLVDGQLLSWYGSRLLLLPPYLKKLSEDMNSVL